MAAVAEDDVVISVRDLVKSFRDREGNEVRVQRPHIDPAPCIGCGACEYACPVFDRKAVYVTSVGESRSDTNQILLERQQS